MVRHRDIEEIAAARRGLDQALVLVAERTANLADAVRQRLVGDRHAGPDRLHHLVLGDDPAGIFHEIAQHFERLGPQRHRPRGPLELQPREIQREAFEPE
jgi:hypothetical protein